MAWYMGHYMLARRMSGPVDRPGEPKFTPQTKAGDETRIRTAFFDLFAKDRANIEAGLYSAPNDMKLERALSTLRNSASFFSDLPKVDKRRVARAGQEVRQQAKGDFPPYYLQNFHYQTGGWLTGESAQLYDTQVEILFGGAADAMRRIVLGQLARALKGKDQRTQRVLDVACGNGRFLSQVLEAFPRLPIVGLDLSPAYCGAARERLRPWRQADVVTGAAEAAPFDDGAFDAATCIYLFHELPPRIRRDVAREIARVVAPGGTLVFADSVQMGDVADLDRMLEYFPLGFHEPYYQTYQNEALEALFGDAGFALEEVETAFLTKVMRFRRKA